MTALAEQQRLSLNNCWIAKWLILQRGQAVRASPKKYDPFDSNYESKLLRKIVDGAGRFNLESKLECQIAAIFARCAAALVVVVHACALARGGC